MRNTIVLIFISLNSFALPTWRLNGGIYGLYLPKNYYKNTSEWFAVPYLDVAYKRIHFFPRYNFDLLHTGSLNAAYDVWLSNNEKSYLSPSVGYTFGDVAGPITGFQVALCYEKFEFYGINQYLFSSRESAQQNWYTWSEASYKVYKYIYPGLSVFLRNFSNTGQTYFDAGPLFVSEFKNLKASVYLMNVWNEKIYCFIGFSFALK